MIDVGLVDDSYYPIDASAVSLDADQSGNLASRQFRNVMRRFAATVSIISVGSGANCRGMTATSVASLSMEPPALLVCVNRSAAMRDCLDIGARFCVNVLNESQAELSDAFGGKAPGEKHFRIGGWQQCASGLPYLDTAQANVFCIVDELFEYATHTIFVGKVYHSRYHETINPLIYLDGNYGLNLN